MKSIALFFKDGKSDKVYQASIDPEGNGYVVNFAFGRRGTTLQTGQKTTAPVPLGSAENIFNKLIAEKKAKGYTEGPNGTPYAHTEKAPTVSGINCKLANPIEDDEIEKFVVDDNYAMQEKIDGKRIMIEKSDADVRGINRKGLYVNLPESVLLAAGKLPGTGILDGELVGETYHAFDLLELDGEDVKEESYTNRALALKNWVAPHQGTHFRLVQTAWTKEEKLVLLQTLQRQKGEGIMLKEKKSVYRAGRPSSGGSWRKFKFYSTASFIVSKEPTGKRSVNVELLDGKKRVPVGSVTIAPNAEIPPVNAVIECRYLYAFRGGKIYQPTFLMVRDDIDISDCKMAQLKFKAENGNGEEE